MKANNNVKSIFSIDNSQKFSALLHDALLSNKEADKEGVSVDEWLRDYLRCHLPQKKEEEIDTIVIKIANVITKHEDSLNSLQNALDDQHTVSEWLQGELNNSNLTESEKAQKIVEAHEALVATNNSYENEGNQTELLNIEKDDTVQNMNPYTMSKAVSETIEQTNSVVVHSYSSQIIPKATTYGFETFLADESEMRSLLHNPDKKQDLKKVIACVLEIADDKQILPIEDSTTEQRASIASISVESAKNQMLVYEGEISSIQALTATKNTAIAAIAPMIIEKTSKSGYALGRELGTSIGKVFGPAGSTIGGFIGGAIGKGIGVAVGEKIVETTHQMSEYAITIVDKGVQKLKTEAGKLENRLSTLLSASNNS